MVSLQGKVVSATFESAVGSVVRLRLSAPIEDDDLGAAAMQLVLAQRLGISEAGVSHLICVTHDVPVVQKSTRQTMLVLLGARDANELPMNLDELARLARSVGYRHNPAPRLREEYRRMTRRAHEVADSILFPVPGTHPG